MNKNGHNSFIHDSPELENTQISVNKRMDKHFMVYFPRMITTQQWKRMNYYF